MLKQLGKAPVYIYSNFLSDEDADAAIALIQEQEVAKGREAIEISKIAGYRVCRTTPEVREYLHVLSQNVIPVHNLDVELTTRTASLGVWNKGSRCIGHADNVVPWSKMLTHSSVIYLNDEYEGGYIAFPDYNEQYRPRRGDLIIFEADIFHEVTEITDGKRYTAALWHTTDTQYDMFRINNDKS